MREAERVNALLNEQATMRAERERVKALLTEAVTLLCKNSVTHQQEVEVEGLLGITVDKSEVFLVSLHEVIYKGPSAQQLQLNAPQFASTPSFSPTSSKRKRRRKSGEATPQIPAKKMTPTATLTPSADNSEAIVLEDDDEGSNETPDFQDDSAQTPGDKTMDSSQGQGEPVSDTTYEEFQDSAAFPDQLALDSASKPNDRNEANVSRVPGQVSEEPFGTEDEAAHGASDSMVSVKRERLDSFTPQEDDSLGGEGYEGFDQEQKWSATMGMMQQGEGPPGMMAGANFGMSPGTSTQQSNTQNGALHKGIWADVSCRPFFVKADETITHSSDQSDFLCPKEDCGLEFDDGLDLLRHQISDEHFVRKHCILCDRTFTRIYDLKRHIMSVHEKVRFQCEHCMKEFKRLDTYKAHQTRSHGVIFLSEPNK